MKTKDSNSNTNQTIKGDFVRREVLTCFSYEMDAILKQDGGTDKENKLPTFEDIENSFEYLCPECGNGYQKEDEALACCNTEKEVESQFQEIFEWWIVSSFLYEKLKAKGQPVLEFGNNCYWGRCTTGQAILLDGVITEICEEMEILDGQKFSWAKKGDK